MVKNLQCPGCGAPIISVTEKCPYCGRMIEIEKPKQDESVRQNANVNSSNGSIGQKIDAAISSFGSIFSSGKKNADQTPANPNYNTQPAVEGKSRGVAILLCLILGMIGAHCFYLGNKGKGILMLILTFSAVAAFVPAVFLVIDFLSLIGTSQTDFDAKYNKAA